MSMRLIGAKVPRVEDRRILTGRGYYIDDVFLPRLLHAAFLRSPFAHARITGIEASVARCAPGVVTVLTGEDIKAAMKPVPITMAGTAKVPEFHALATDRVRFVGDPVAVIVAKTRREAEDAAELVDVSYDPLPPVTTSESALDPASQVLFDDLDDNILAADFTSVGDVDAAFAGADRVVELSLRQHRVAPSPMETRGAVADYDSSCGELNFHCNVQHPHGLRLDLAGALSLPVERVRVFTPDIGGGFGLKGSFGREEFCLAAAARLVERPVKWIEDRYEHLLAAGHARDETVDVAVAVSRDGTLLAMRANLILNQGAYPKAPFPAASVTSSVRTLLPGPYRWEAYELSRTIVATNRCTYVSYRGPWAVETWVRERILDEVARDLHMDPAELRRRNVVAGGPHDRLVTGPSLAGVASRETLERALEMIGYDDFRRQQPDERAAGRHLGVGFASFIEAAPGPPDMRAGTHFGGEQAKVKLETNGHLSIVTSQTPGGQSHETTLAQIAADEMGVAFDHVKVRRGDTSFTPFKFIGTGGSMAATWANGAVRMSTRKVKEKVLAIAGEMLEISPEDLEISDGVVMARGVPSKSLPLTQIATQATMFPATFPAGTDCVLEAHERFLGEGITGSGWSGGTHACTVEVDLGTGRVKILRYVVAEDCGPVVNPAIVEGQIRGGVAQGIGQVLYEKAAYDQDGNFLAATFMDYLLPTATEIPPIEIEHIETDPEGEFGFRGVGEGGCIVAPAALTNAIADALAPLGVRISEQYLPPAKVLELAGVIEALESSPTG